MTNPIAKFLQDHFTIFRNHTSPGESAESIGVSIARLQEIYTSSGDPLSADELNSIALYTGESLEALRALVTPAKSDTPETALPSAQSAANAPEAQDQAATDGSHASPLPPVVSTIQASLPTEDTMPKNSAKQGAKRTPRNKKSPAPEVSAAAPAKRPRGRPPKSAGKTTSSTVVATRRARAPKGSATSKDTTKALAVIRAALESKADPLALAVAKAPKHIRKIIATLLKTA